jgi:hypothetical protein
LTLRLATTIGWFDSGSQRRPRARVVAPVLRVA